MREKKLKFDFFLFEIVVAASVLLLIAAIIYPYSIYVKNNVTVRAIENQLTSFGMKARMHMRDIGIRRMKYSSIVDAGVANKLEVYSGESYDNLIFDVDGGIATVKTSSGKEISSKY